MKLYLDCISCMVRQTLDAAQHAVDNPLVHERLMRQVLMQLSSVDMSDSPPAMAQRIHRLIRKEVAQTDPYRAQKDRYNALALQWLDNLRQQVQRSAEPFETAVRLAIAGNIIDLGVKSSLSPSDLEATVIDSLTAPLDAHAVREFAIAAHAASDILYLADNAGEIVFDRLLIEQLGSDRVTVVVRGGPVINDATMRDADMAGLTGMVSVIDNGSDAPGTIFSDCSESFRDRFDRADLVIAKGQGNYETLSDVDRDIVFILKAKCPVIARDMGCAVGDMVLRYQRVAVSSARKETANAQR